MSTTCIGSNKIDTDKKKLILLHTVTSRLDREDGSSFGNSVEVLFVQKDYCEDILGVSFDKFMCSSIVGKEIFVDRNRKGYPQAITIAK